MIEPFGALTLKELWPVHPRLRFGVSVSYAIFFCALVCSSPPPPPLVVRGLGLWSEVGLGLAVGGGGGLGLAVGVGVGLGLQWAGVLSWYGGGEWALS